jgi:outer membrane protein OmpA-like peptidoglycan-associated protein
MSIDPNGADNQKAEQSRSLDALGVSKLCWEMRKLRLEVILQSLAVVYILALSLGAMLIFLYFFRHDFNAGGISAADTVSMVLTSLSFIGLTACFLFLFMCAGYPFVRFAHWSAHRFSFYQNSLRNKKGTVGIDTVSLSKKIGMPFQLEWKKGYFFVLVVGIFLLIFIALLIYESNSGLVYMLIPLLGAGMWLSMFVFGEKKHIYCPWPKIPPTHKVDIWLSSLPGPWRDVAISVVVVTILVGIGSSGIEDFSLTAVGFRKQNVSVRLSKDDFRQFVDRAVRSGLVINPCEAIEEGAFLVNGVDVLWHKLGTQGLLRFPSQPIGAETKSSQLSLRMEPLNANISVIEMHAKKLQCEEFLLGVLFKRESATMLASAGARLERDLAWIRDGQKGSFIRIATHSTSLASTPLGKQDESLSHRQGEAIRNFLMQTYGLQPASVLVVDVADTEPKLDCSEDATVMHNLCEKMNRRIEISRYFPADG